MLNVKWLGAFCSFDVSVGFMYNNENNGLMLKFVAFSLCSFVVV